MAKHEHEREGIIYIFPDDDSYRMYKQGEASLDKRGRLIHKKKKYLIRILEHRTAPKQPSSNYTQNPNNAQQSTTKKFQEEMRNSLRSGVKSSVRKKSMQITDDLIDWGFYTAFPKLKRKVIEVWDAAHSEPKISKIVEVNHSSTIKEVVVSSETKQQVQAPMTDAEAEAEVKNFVSHYIEMIKSLLKLRNAGRLEELNKLLPQLTSKSNIERFNSTLSANPNLLEMTKNNEISKLLGRDLFQGGEFVPIEVNEIIELATVNDQEDI